MGFYLILNYIQWNKNTYSKNCIWAAIERIKQEAVFCSNRYREKELKIRKDPHLSRSSFKLARYESLREISKTFKVESEDDMRSYLDDIRRYVSK